MDPEAGRRRNILIAALLRDSTTRRVVVLGGHDLHVPEYLFDEIEIHRDELAKRSGQTTDALEEALRILRGHVTEHEEADYVDELGKRGLVRNVYTRPSLRRPLGAPCAIHAF